MRHDRQRGTDAARGLVAVFLLCVNLLFWGIPFLILAAGKVVLPDSGRRRLLLVLAAIAEIWAGWNSRIADALLPTRWDLSIPEGLRRDGRYLMISNHVSWLDIAVILRAFHRRVPLPRFFLKKELIWLPIIGLAAWALEFPFMRRYSAEEMERHPEKRGRDLETTRRACQRYRSIPVTILNFLEGTRFTGEKQSDQESPYRHLLRPRSGGVAFVLASLGDQLDGILDVTIAYPRQPVSMWDFLCGRVRTIVLRARLLDVPPEFQNPAIAEPGPERQRFKAWLETVWQEKDELLDRLV